MGNLSILKRVIMSVIALFFYISGTAQERRLIVVERTDSLEYSEKIERNAERLLGNVKISHNGALMYCDSAYFYAEDNKIKAFGNIHVNRGDTLQLYGDSLNYYGDEGFADVIGNVVLEDEMLTLTTDRLDYNLTTDIGYYNCGGTIVDSVNVLTSVIGRYYALTNMTYFRDSVVVNGSDFMLYSDTLKYNTVSELVYLCGPTDIETKDSTGTFYTERGWYDTKNSIAHLTKKSIYRGKDNTLYGDTIHYVEADGVGTAYSNVKVEDLKNRIEITGNKAIYNEITEDAIVTKRATFIQYMDSDTLYLHADTLLSLNGEVEESKVFKAYRGARYFKRDIQGKCDSLVYSTQDSITSLYYNPVVWTLDNQMTADSIKMINNSEDPDYVNMYSNAFIISKEGDNMYNQIKGKVMNGFIADGELYQMDVKGNGRSVYYAQEDTVTVGVNMVECSDIILYFKDRAIDVIDFIENPSMDLVPPSWVSEEQAKLNMFVWLDEIRPKSRDDIYGVSSKEGSDIDEMFIRYRELLNDTTSLNRVNSIVTGIDPNLLKMVTPNMVQGMSKLDIKSILLSIDDVNRMEVDSLIDGQDNVQLDLIKAVVLQQIGE